MSTSVLIAAPGDDIHALVVRDRIRRRGARGVIVDAATFPAGSKVEWSQGQGSARATLRVAPALPLVFGRHAAIERIEHCSLEEIRIEEVSAVWMRRPRAPVPAPSVREPELRSFASLMTRHALEAFFAACRIHNDPARERRADLKPLQLQLAAACGLHVPRTLISSDPESILEFVREVEREGRRVIFKPVASTRDGPPTRSFAPEDLSRLDDVCLCPTIFQERIEGGIDLRVALVGSRTFAAEWRAAGGTRPTADIRLECGTRMWPTTLPPTLQERLLNLHEEFGLTLGVYDFKMDAKGEPFFLEVNTGGQWLDLEVEAGYPVSDAMAQELLGASGELSGPYKQADLDGLSREESEAWKRIVPASA